MCRQAGNGPNPARSAALLAGIPADVPAATINMACPSGMKTLLLAADTLRAGNADVCLCGGMDSMSTIPHLVRGLRFKPKKMGDLAIEDGWKDATDPIAQTTMGDCAERLARERGISRADQDACALESHRRATAAATSGGFDAELVPLSLPAAFGHGPVALTADETPRPDTTIERLAALPPAFAPDGSVTAGNSSAMSNGACALVVMTRSEAIRRGCAPLARLVAGVSIAVDGAFMGDGPSRSIPAVLHRAGMTLADMDLIEVNEAFAVQMLANERALSWNRERVNVHGGAIALGHPTGISGARIVVTLLHALRARNGRFGLAAICGAGGVSTALIVEREG